MDQYSMIPLLLDGVGHLSPNAQLVLLIGFWLFAFSAVFIKKVHQRILAILRLLLSKRKNTKNHP